MEQNEQLRARVIAIIEQAMKMEAGRVQPASTFEELAIDSLDGINIAFALESEFNINIPDDELPKMRSVADITAGIAELLATKESGASVTPANSASTSNGSAA
jgi:acyl carrier protein